MKKQLLLFSLLITSFCTYAQNGLNLDGTDDYVQTTYAGVTGSADRTFEAWVYLNSAPSSNLSILDYGSSATGSRNTFMVNSNGYLAYIAGGINTNITGATSTVPIGSWAHVALVMDNGTGYLYVNGTQVGTGSLSGVSTPISTNLRIGQRVSGGNIPFAGAIDEVRIWDVARTATEISTNMNDEFCDIPNNLVAYYKFNSGTAAGNNSTVTTAIDEVAGNNGTLTNFGLTGSTSNWVAGASIGSGSGAPTSVTINSCGPYSSNTGHVWTTNGNYVDTITGPTGCDSIVNIALTVTPNSTNTISATGCNDYTVPSGSRSYTQSGTVYDTLPSANGCDSILTINLTINVIDTAVLVNGAFLTSYVNNANYQWLDCNNGYAPIAGATGQVFQATSNGSYAVMVDDNGCIDTSGCHLVTKFAIDEFAANNMRNIFPNPAKNNVKIVFEKTYKNVEVSFVNVAGMLVLKSENKNVSEIALPINLPAGMYLVQVKADETFTTQKITVQ